MPKYDEISEWIRDWMIAQPPESIEKAFRLCGFVSPEIFQKKDLHKPLRDCYSDNFCEDQWQSDHGNVVEPHHENLIESCSEWTLFDVDFSLLKAFYEHEKDNQIEDFEYWKE